MEEKNLEACAQMINKILQIFAKGNNAELLRDFERRGIKCSRPTLVKWLSKKKCDMDCRILEKIINSYHIHHQFFEDPVCAKFFGEHSVIEKNWSEVAINVRGVVLKHFHQTNFNKEKTYRDLGISRESFELFIKDGTRKEDLPCVKLSMFRLWLKKFGMESFDFIKDLNLCILSVEDIEKMQVDEKYSALVAEDLKVELDDARYIHEKQKYNAIKKYRDRK